MEQKLTGESLAFSANGARQQLLYEKDDSTGTSPEKIKARYRKKHVKKKDVNKFLKFAYHH